MTEERECPHCDEPLSRLWIHPPAHSDDFHAGLRRRLTDYVRILLWEKTAVLLGHRVHIRFTQQWAWPECSCGWTGYVWTGSTRAVYQGHVHLYTMGREHELTDRQSS